MEIGIVSPDYSEAELLAWAGVEIGEPFRKIAAIADDIGKGRELTGQEALVRLPLTNTKVDYRGIYPILRDAMPVLAFEPAHLLVLALDTAGDSILAARLVIARDNNYVKIQDLATDEEWAALALDLIKSGDRDQLRHQLDEWFIANKHQEINCVIVVKPEGLSAIRNAWQDYHAEGDGYFSLLYRAVGSCVENEWIIFAPIPRLLARLVDIYRIVDAPAGAWNKIFSKDSYPLKIAVALWGRNYVSAFVHDSRKSEPLGLDIDRLPKGVEPDALVKALKRETGATYAFVLHADMVINLLHEILNRPLPTSGADSKVLIKKMLYFLRGYKSLWWMYPTAVPLKNYIRWPIRALGMPYDITRLSWWSLPDIIVDGMGIFIGDAVRYGVVLLKGDEPRGVLLIDSYNRGLKKITVVPADELREIFAGAPMRHKDMRERAIRAKHLLWDKYGWVDWINVIQVETLEYMRKLMFGGYFGSLLKVPLAAPTAIKLKKSIARGGLIIYPDAIIEEAARYRKSVGAGQLRRQIIKVPFDAYGKTTRGPLFIRETLIAAGAMGGLIALLIWLF